MVLMTSKAQIKSEYSQAASDLQASITRHLWDEDKGVMRFSSSSPASGICQSTNSYASSLGLVPGHRDLVENVSASGEALPAAFQGLGHWDKFGISSPYASGFTLEALMARNEPAKALELLHQVWGPMADKQNPNYSGAHWEAMDRDGNPFNHDVSLAHGWSTWPVFLLPRYLAGIYPLEPGWRKIAVEPVLADLDDIAYSVESVRGLITIAISMNKTRENGTMQLLLPVGTAGVVSLPASWSLLGVEEISGSGEEITLHLVKE